MTDPNRNATGTAGDGQTSYGYDRANRLTSIDYSDSTPDVTFSYDSVGNRLQMADGSGTETRTYDNLERLLSVTRGTNTFLYVYDAASNITRRTYPGGTVADYAYDPLNRLASAASGGQTTSYCKRGQVLICAQWRLSRRLTVEGWRPMQAGSGLDLCAVAAQSPAHG